MNFSKSCPNFSKTLPSQVLAQTEKYLPLVSGAAALLFLVTLVFVFGGMVHVSEQ